MRQERNISPRPAQRKYSWHTEAKVTGHLDDWLEDYFGCITMIHKKGGYSLLTGELPDISAVYGLILRLLIFNSCRLRDCGRLFLPR